MPPLEDVEGGDEVLDEPARGVGVGGLAEEFRTDLEGPSGRPLVKGAKGSEGATPSTVRALIQKPLRPGQGP